MPCPAGRPHIFSETWDLWRGIRLVLVGRLAASLLRLLYRVVPERALFWGMVLADDFKFEAAGPDFVEVLLLVVLTAEVLGFPWSWGKLRGGTDFTWVGYQHQLREHALGLSENRAAWLRGWLGSVLDARVVHVREFVAGLGRAAYACGALEYDRPFLAPLYTFASLHPLDSHQPLPTYVLSVVKFLRDRLLIRRMYPCAQPVEIMAETIRVDAKAEGGRRPSGAGSRVATRRGKLTWPSPRGTLSSWTSTSRRGHTKRTDNRFEWLRP